MATSSEESTQRPRPKHRRAGQIVPRGERTWLIRIFLGRDGTGRRRYHNRTVHGTKKDAQTILNGLLTESDRGSIVEPSRETLDAFLDRWLRDVASVKVRGNTFTQYSHQLRVHVRPVLGPVRLSDLELADFNRLYRGMEQRGLSARTVRLTHGVICVALEHAVTKEKTLPRNPARPAELPRAIRPEIKALDAVQVAKLREVATKNRHGALLMFAVATGMRPSEYLALRWTDVDLEACSATVVRTIHKAGKAKWRVEQPKTKSSRRTVKFPLSIARTLKAHRATQAKARLAAGTAWQDHDLVFCSEIGTPVDTHNLKTRHFKPLLIEAGLPPSTRLYDLRHTMATLLIEDGVDARTVADRLGHSSVNMTLNTYTHPTTEMQEKAARRLEDLIFPSAGPGREQKS